MIKLTFCLHRLPSLSRDAFQRYWREQHAPLVARHASTLRIRRYVQMHSLPEGDPVNGGLRASRGAPQDYDGVAELWWDDLDDLAAATASEAGRAASLALLEDERRFIDLARSPLWLGREHVVIG
ncbi:EthD domain-containing protein [Candidatus Binatia bacterium]|nr:EthD domain-containing protein [Candidatus Binatia bacterium]